MKSKLTVCFLILRLFLSRTHEKQFFLKKRVEKEKMKKKISVIHAQVRGAKVHSQ